ncbi:MAG: fatty acid desaturase [Euryarchaeota archaeon]
MSETSVASQNIEVELKPEPWAVHLLGLITPILAIFGNILGVVENQAYVAMGVVFVWGIAPILDIVMGESKVARPPRESGTPFEILLWVHGILQLVVVATFFVFAANEGMTWWLVVGALSSGLSASASAIVTAHELGHKKRGSPGWRLARVLLFSVHYTHFTYEHNHVHHKWVSTAKDSASAEAHQGLWSFWMSTIPGQFFSSASVHNKKGKTGISNPTYRGLLLQTVTLFAIAFLPGMLEYFDGIPVAVGWLVMSGIAILTLEYVNYIRHWGLRRSEDERFAKEHSWNTEARWSRWSLLELTRHSDHHLRASVPFWKLRPYEGTPELRWGYYASWWPCLVPPIWKRAMASRLPNNQ